MLLDKLTWTRMDGHWFTLFGIANLVGYGLSYVMSKKNYDYHFTYTGEGQSLFRPVKSMIGSTNLLNVVWTAPVLIGFGYELNKRMGALFTTKFFFLSLFTSYAFWSVFNP